jgi:hypothetical protein
MKIKPIILFFLLIVISAGFTNAQQNPVEKGLCAITKASIQSQLEFLASDWTEGRETTTKGEFIAGDYIASMFKYIGLQPAGDMIYGPARYMPGQPMQEPKATRSYFQTIPFVENISNESLLELIEKEGTSESKYIFNQDTDYSLYNLSSGREFTASIVFVGYGLKIDELNINDFKGVDVRGKVVLCVSGFPKEFFNKDSEAYKKLNLNDRESFWKLYQAKEELLNKLGAAAVIQLPGYNRSNAANYHLRYNTNIYEGDKPLNNNQIRLSLPQDSLKNQMLSISVSSKIGNELINGTGIDITDFMKNYSLSKKTTVKEIKGKLIHFRNTVKTRTLNGRNVLGMIEGENPNEVIVIGAHYDHVGMYNGYIWNGSDDNASGTVGVMTIARAMIASGIKPKKTIIFAAWTGEEKGLFGSNYFVDKYKNKKDLALNLNFDMISRKPEKDSVGFKTGMDYTQAYPILKELVEKANTNYNLGLTVDFRPSKRPQAGTDFSPFAAKDIPIYGFDAAFTEDYHGPFDHVEKADLDLMSKIIKTGYLTIFEIANMDKKIEPAN